MPSGLSVSLPFRRDPQDGFGMNKTYKDVAVQNLKMLILTSPGERIMDPLFGVGLRDYLFDQDLPTTHGSIAARIRSQVAKYLPYIHINNVSFDSQGTGNVDHPNNQLSITVDFVITPLELSEQISLSVE
tara:strand:- start:533 stop:922 length:390 start_codon:yes stop_codon:yes gene_type:complete